MVDIPTVASDAAAHGAPRRARRSVEVMVVVSLLVLAVALVFGPRWWWAYPPLIGLAWLPFASALMPRRRSKDEAAPAAEQLAGLLAALEPDGYVVLHDIETTAGRIDHVVVGPTGIFSVQAKAWRGWVSLGRSGRLIRNGLNAGREMRASIAQSMELERRLRQAHLAGFVHSILVLTRTKLGSAIHIDTATIVDSRHVASFIRSHPFRPLQRRQVTRVVSAIRRHDARVANRTTPVPRRRRSTPRRAVHLPVPVEQNGEGRDVSSSVSGGSSPVQRRPSSVKPRRQGYPARHKDLRKVPPDRPNDG